MRGDGGDILSRLAPYARARHDGPDGIHLVLDGVAGPLRIVIVVDRQSVVVGTWFVIDDGHLGIRLACVARLGRLLAGQAPGPLPSTLRLSSQQKLRQIRMLCIAEGRRMGVATRRIAAGLYGERILHLSRNEWRASSWHRAFYRDLDGAAFYLNGGHVALLHGLKQGGDSLAA
ncbi:DNA -binding domain-containing protein [Gluconacetobacter asukensis]|uniref:DNA -binding domain-containing protein n=1 Tax=Gluconacetobacter asukensis TaxID=1017181 RepID=UPI0030840826